VRSQRDPRCALEVDKKDLEEMFALGKARVIETRGTSDHKFVQSIYFRDPNGYVTELTAKTPEHDQDMDLAANGAREKLDRWQLAKAAAGGTHAKMRLE
jgi:catechol-2,3-dioxygenase